MITRAVFSYSRPSILYTCRRKVLTSFIILPEPAADSIDRGHLLCFCIMCKKKETNISLVNCNIRIYNNIIYIIILSFIFNGSATNSYALFLFIPMATIYIRKYYYQYIISAARRCLQFYTRVAASSHHRTFTPQ